MSSGLEVTTLMDQAARLAFRGRGLVEPGCLVGAVVTDAAGNVIAEGRYARFGGPHAERVALMKAGDAARGGTLLVTLEPCNHHGKTPPCTEAVIESGVKRVIHACHDPNDLASGGTEALTDAGIEVLHQPTALTRLLNAPHIHRTRHQLPWIVAKWAQTLDGRIATRTGASKWISSERSRRLVHRERGRVDAVFTGIGTVLADDPMLTARDLRKPRRRAERVVVDDSLQIPLQAKIIQTARDHPTTVLCSEESLKTPHAEELRSAGVRLARLPTDGTLTELIRMLTHERNWSTILVESGGGLMGRLFKERLINEILVFTSPVLLGDQSAPGAVRGFCPEEISEGLQLELCASFQRKPDVVSVLRVRDPAE